MTIEARCPGCKREYNLADRLAGKKVRCKECGEEFKAPAPALERNGRGDRGGPDDSPSGGRPRRRTSSRNAPGPYGDERRGGNATHGFRGRVTLLLGLGGAAALAAFIVVAILVTRNKRAPVDAPPPVSAALPVGGPGPAATAMEPRDAALLAQMKEPTTERRQDACQQIGLHRINPRVMVPALIAALGDPTPEVRRMAAWALGRLGDEAQAAVPALSSALTDKDRGVVLAALGTLGGMGPAARAAAPAIRSLATDIDHPQRAEALGALTKIDASGSAALAEDAKDPVAKALAELRSTEKRRRDFALLTLVGVPPNERQRAEVVKVLRELLAAPGSEKDVLATAISVWAGPDAAPMLLSLLQRADDPRPPQATPAHLMRLLTPLKYEPAIPFLVSYLWTLETDWAKRALVAIGPAAEKALLPYVTERTARGGLFAVSHGLTAVDVLRYIGTKKGFDAIRAFRQPLVLPVQQNQCDIALGDIARRMKSGR
jgi:hypothetical protein